MSSLQLSQDRVSQALFEILVASSQSILKSQLLQNPIVDLSDRDVWTWLSRFSPHRLMLVENVQEETSLQFQPERLLDSALQVQQVDPHGWLPAVVGTLASSRSSQTVIRCLPLLGNVSFLPSTVQRLWN